MALFVYSDFIPVCVCVRVCVWVQVKELISKCPEAISRTLLKARLSEKQWEAVMLINHALRQEYECRRQMLLQRLDVTILSFQWSDRAKVSVAMMYVLRMWNIIWSFGICLFACHLPFYLLLVWLHWLLLIWLHYISEFSLSFWRAVHMVVQQHNCWELLRKRRMQFSFNLSVLICCWLGYK